MPLLRTEVGPPRVRRIEQETKREERLERQTREKKSYLSKW